MAEIKMTRKELFEGLLKLDQVKANSVYVEKLKHEIEMCVKKSAGGSTKVDNTELKGIILAELGAISEPVSITDLMKKSEVIANYTYVSGKEEKHLTNQKISSVLTEMYKIDKTVVRTEKGKKVLFSVAE